MELQGRYIISGTESAQELRRIAEDRRSTLILSLSSIRSMMSAFLEGRMSAASLEEMAEYLEMNEAVFTQPEEAARVNHVIFMLANPEINFPTDSQKVRALLEAIEPFEGSEK